jgi:TusA-related sulfurtransferase
LDEEIQILTQPRTNEEKIRSQIRELRVRCFKAFPDYEMWEIGVECAAVLVRLNELVNQIPTNEVVHIISDDPTADIEMVRWSDQTGQQVLESRPEGKLTHFIVRKVK